jgi:hypothetical protein
MTTNSTSASLMPLTIELVLSAPRDCAFVGSSAFGTARK